MLYVLASDILAPLGQAAAIILAIYMSVSIIIGLVFSVLLMYGFAWVREKSELVKKLRPTVDSINTTISAGGSETLPATVDQSDKLLQTIHKFQSVQVDQKAKDVQEQVNIIEKKVGSVTDRIAEGVIEFRARTLMVQGMLKVFFLPGLTKQKPRTPLLLPVAPDFSSAQYTTLPAESSSLSSESSNVLVAQALSGGGVQPIGSGGPEPLAREGAERAADEPGH
jgi:hypothetical protein